jgi:hypothetical protein
MGVRPAARHVGRWCFLPGRVEAAGTGHCLKSSAPDAALFLPPLNIRRDDRLHRGLALLDRPRPRIRAEDAKRRHPGRGELAVAEVKTEEIGVGRLIVRRPWRPRVSRTYRLLRVELSPAALVRRRTNGRRYCGRGPEFCRFDRRRDLGRVAVMPFRGCGPGACPHLRTGVRQFPWCRGRDSNPHVLSDKSF